MLRSTLIILLLLLASCQTKKENNTIKPEAAKAERRFNFPDSLSSARMTFAMILRDSVANNHWQSFNEKRTEGPFIYFNKEHSEIFFPDSIMRLRLPDAEPYSKDYMLHERTDTIPYHFELMLSFNEADSAKFYYDHPVQQFLSVEATEEFIPSVRSTEWWATMVIHEMFHHFQYNQKAFLNYAKHHIGALPADIRDLRKLCTIPEYYEGVQKENDLLMEALATNDNTQLHQKVNAYLESRKKRINRFKHQLPDLEVVENYYIIQEGSARYIEYQTMRIMKSLFAAPERAIIPDDPKFKAYADFKSIDLNHDGFNYLIFPAPSDYHYTLGFNLLRVLDKLGVDYKEKIFEHPERGLHEYLTQDSDSKIEFR